MAAALAFRPARRYLSDDAPVLAGVAVLCAVYLVGLTWLELRVPSLRAYALYSEVYLWGLAFLLIGRALAIGVRTRSTAGIAQDLAERLPRLVMAAPLICALIMFMQLFGSVKAAIPAINPYSWDAIFIAWDQALFFGTDPWRLLQPVLGFPSVSAGIGALYKLWLELIFAGSWYMAAYVDDRRLRARYFLAYFMTWFIVGSVLAIAFSSVGPVFLEPLTGNAHFAAQTAYLAQAHQQVFNIAVAAQGYLLSLQQSGTDGIGAGISAMPSMHVALALLFWLTVRRHSAEAGGVFAVFLGVIALGSVHLAYHYAVDGLVAAAVVLGLWRLAGWAATRIVRGEDEPAAPEPLPA